MKSSKASKRRARQEVDQIENQLRSLKARADKYGQNIGLVLRTRISVLEQRRDQLLRTASPHKTHS